MRIVMTLLVRDEEDVLAANLDFHFAQGVDFVIATDNLSVDRTPQILRDYERRRSCATTSAEECCATSTNRPTTTTRPSG